ncbi:MAG: FAD-dependent oxidoreductase [Thermoproteus sp. AZ2]|jgi:NAD(P)-dependent dehydrogenase (short-subunit alcohol dehydrogenase family)|uniref:FAD-dependent oxidoreductase n=1 Tax=Thermoproteus sp. AZ2 TaxID=1609232 RepID=A0ACC6V019_9CREN|nr:MAG: pyridine nucleotide-disulfide oxidoreductase [Thermoproteus sp. AZ2]
MSFYAWIRDGIRRPDNCAEQQVDVLIVGAGIGGLAAARALAKYGFRTMVVGKGPRGGHNALDGQPTITGEPASTYISRYNDVEVIDGVFDGEVVIAERCIRPRYKHLVLNTGGVEMYPPLPGSPKVALASDALAGGVDAERLLVWGTSEWGLRTALALAERGHKVLVADNSAYLRDVKYYQRVEDKLRKLGVDVIYSATVKRFKDGEVVLAVNAGKKGVEERRVEADLFVSAARTANLFLPFRLGLKVFYSFELNSLVPRRSSFGEVLSVDDRGKAVAGTNIYVVGELYGAVYAHHQEEQGAILASYIAAKEGVEDLDKASKELEQFRAKLAVELNWLYNLDLRLSRGTDYSGIYAEPNVIDAPGWPYFWPNLSEVDGDQVLCPCTGLKIKDLMNAVRRANEGAVRMRVTSDEVNKLRHLKLPTLVQLGSGPSPCFEAFCVPNIAIITAAIYAQKPSYVLYGKPKQLYAAE